MPFSRVGAQQAAFFDGGRSADGNIFVTLLPGECAYPGGGRVADLFEEVPAAFKLTYYYQYGNLRCGAGAEYRPISPQVTLE